MTGRIGPNADSSILNWVSSQGRSLDGNTVEPGKPVAMRERPEGPHEPKVFAVRRRRDGFLDRLRERMGHPPVETGATIPTRRTGSSAWWRSSSPWSAGLLPGRRQSLYEFVCDDGHRSPVLAVSSVGFSVRYEQATGLTKASVWPLTAILEGSRSELQFVIGASVDPLLEVEVLTPWGTGRESLSDHIAEELGLDTPAELEEGVLFEGPEEDWDLGLTADSVWLEAGETQVISLQVSGPSRARAAFALRVSQSDDPTRSVVSEVVEVTMDQRGGFTSRPNAAEPRFDAFDTTA